VLAELEYIIMMALDFLVFMEKWRIAENWRIGVAHLDDDG
jgi:hypothetical protein